MIQPGGTRTDLGSLAGGTSWAKGVNDRARSSAIRTHRRSNAARDVVGESGRHALLYRDGLHDLGGPMGYSIARAVNDAGQVVGLNGSSPVDGHAFLYADGEMTDLGTLGRGFSSAFDINNHGEIVGWTDVEGVDGRLAFLYADGEMRTLDSLIAGATAARIDMAWAINDAGQILTSGCEPGACGSQGPAADAGGSAPSAIASKCATTMFFPCMPASGEQAVRLGHPGLMTGRRGRFRRVPRLDTIRLRLRRI